MRNRASFLYEDLLVARAAYLAAVKRWRGAGPKRRLSKSRQARLDVDHHRAQLRRSHRLFTDLGGGEAALSDEGRRIARSIARDRIKNDLRPDDAVRPCRACHDCPAAKAVA